MKKNFMIIFIAILICILSFSTNAAAVYNIDFDNARSLITDYFNLYADIEVSQVMPEKIDFIVENNDTALHFAIMEYLMMGSKNANISYDWMKFDITAMQIENINQNEATVHITESQTFHYKGWEDDEISSFADVKYDFNLIIDNGVLKINKINSKHIFFKNIKDNLLKQLNGRGLNIENIKLAKDELIAENKITDISVVSDNPRTDDDTYINIIFIFFSSGMILLEFIIKSFQKEMLS
jgi:hypothetical protein